MTLMNPFSGHLGFTGGILFSDGFYPIGMTAGKNVQPVLHE